MEVIDWLLGADPSIRWQVMRDLTHTPPDVVATEFAGAVGAPNRWITLRALRVLEWSQQSRQHPRAAVRAASGTNAH